MIKSVTVTNYLDESITLELKHPEKTGITIVNIDGLGPAKANINTTEIATTDGSVYNSSRLDSRNIVMTLEFDFYPTVEDVRQKVYKYFPIGKKIKLEIESSNRTVEIYGYIETNEPNIFSKQENTQISIICPDPYFYDINITTSSFAGYDPQFEFPFSNESLTEPLIEVGVLRIEQREIVNYTGDVEVGVSMHIYADGAVKDIVIYNLDTRESMTIISSRFETLIGSAIRKGDEIIISTIKGSKSITLLRNGDYTNILNCLDRYSDWFQLSRGDNLFVYTAASGGENLRFIFTNRIVYEGV